MFVVLTPMPSAIVATKNLSIRFSGQFHPVQSCPAGVQPQPT